MTVRGFVPGFGFLTLCLRALSIGALLLLVLVLVLVLVLDHAGHLSWQDWLLIVFIFAAQLTGLRPSGRSRVTNPSSSTRGSRPF